MQIEDSPGRLHLVSGVSIASAKLNILDCDGFGLMNYFEGRCREGEYQNRDCLYVGTRTGEKIILISGGGKEGDERYIKGNTYATAYITEANECTPSFLKEAFDRTLSSKNRHIFHDLNPKDPAHWYYQDILNFHEQQQQANPDYGYNYGHFTIADNMSVSTEKIRQALVTYDKRSVWYHRDILGERTAAEGLVYPMFDDKENTYDDTTRPPHLESYARRYAAIDYGTENPCVFLDIYDDNETVWIDREYYYDGRKEGKPKTDHQYGDDFEQFFSARPLLTDIVMDPSADSFEAELTLRGYTVTPADNDVVPGLRNMATLIQLRHLKANKRCEHLLQEIRGYIWDEKARQRGDEKPLKIGDHTQDAARYFVRTILPVWRRGE